MSRSGILASGFLVVGLLIGGYVVDRATGQTSVATRPLPTWPPLPQDFVDRQGPVTLGMLGYQTLFDVPSNDWFILTDFSVFTTPWGSELGEDIGGTFTARIDFSSGQWGTRFNSAVGLAFRPGSKVRLFNPPSSLTSTTGSFSIVGYLLPK
jgi:hypothetical protein